MLITYRRTGGVLALLTLGALAIAVTLLTAAVVATVVVVGIAIGAAGLLARAVLPKSWRAQPVRLSTAWPHETIEASVVTPMVSSNAADSTADDFTSGARLHP